MNEIDTENSERPNGARSLDAVARPPLDQLVGRMIEEETLQDVERELRHANEALQAAIAASVAHDWRAVCQYLVILNWKSANAAANAQQMQQRPSHRI